MVATDPVTPETRRFLIRLPRPLWIGLATVVLSLAAVFAGDRAEEESDEDAPPPVQQVHLADSAVYSLVFDDVSDAAAARKKLDALLKKKIAIVDRLCRLTDIQKEQLDLAGRGDNKRLLDRVEELGMQLLLVKNDEKALFQKARTLSRQIEAGLSRDMLLVKSLQKILATEQLVRYQPLRAVLSTGGTVRPWLNGSVDDLDVTLTGTAFADDGLAHLSGLPGVRFLALDGTQVTDAGLVHLKQLTKMRILNLNNTRVTDAGVAQLKGMANLEELFLAHTQVTDAGLANLKGLTRLNLLWLENTPVTDAGLAHLRGLTGLSFLVLSQTRVTDSGLAHLSGCVKLEFLWLADTGMTDAGLVQLQAVPRLKDLRLGGTRVSDAGLALLNGKASLGILTLDNTKVTGGAIAELQRALPDLTISTATPVQGGSLRVVP